MDWQFFLKNAVEKNRRGVQDICQNESKLKKILIYDFWIKACTGGKIDYCWTLKLNFADCSCFKNIINSALESWKSLECKTNYFLCYTHIRHISIDLSKLLQFSQKFTFFTTPFWRPVVHDMHTWGTSHIYGTKPCTYTEVYSKMSR